MPTHWKLLGTCGTRVFLAASAGLLTSASARIYGEDRPTVPPRVGVLVRNLSDLSEDRAQLPDRAELPVASIDADLGRFVLHPTRNHDVSIEERRAAAAVAQLLAYDLTIRSQRVGVA